MDLKRESYRAEIDGKPVDLYTIANRHGMVVRITNWGAKVQQILVPGRDGAPVDVALGYDSLEQLRAGQASMGAFIGRYAGRIANGRFSLKGVEYALPVNNGSNTLHGGVKGSRFQVFAAKQLDDSAVEMSYTFRDGEEGFPGTLPLRVTYSVTDGNELVVEYDAVAVDRPTVANFTSHVFFNLAGHDAGDILGHRLELPASRFLPLDTNLVPTGEMRSVWGTPMDFLEPVAFGERIAKGDEQLRIGTGYDHHFVVDKEPGEMSLAARVTEPASGRTLEVWSTEPGIQVYSGNFLEGQRPRDIGKGGAVYRTRSGFCLEPSRFPDSVNHASFPSTALEPGEWLRGATAYRFGTT